MIIVIHCLKLLLLILFLTFSFFFTALSRTSNDSNSSSLLKESKKYLGSVSNTIYHDFKSIQSMSDIKTEIGKSRAFIRLALERKLLSKHLRTLLTNQEIVEDMYKRYAFLRCEEEREQFLTHLLTLNTVDLLSFTNTFTTSCLNYSLVIFSSGPVTGWVSFSGSICSTHEISLTNVANLFTFKHNNLGLVNTLTIGLSHSSKVFIEYCFLRNEVTGHIFKLV